MNDITITLTAAAQEAYREAETMVNKAHAWVTMTLAMTTAANDEELKALEAKLLAAQEAQREMERSFYKGFAFICTMQIGKDLRIHRDGPGALYWRFENGYEGGLIFHRNHKWPEESGLGTWSIHT